MIIFIEVNFSIKYFVIGLDLNNWFYMLNITNANSDLKGSKSQLLTYIKVCKKYREKKHF